MKKIIFIFSYLFLLFAITACGGNKSGNENFVSTTNTTQIIADTPVAVGDNHEDTADYIAVDTSGIYAITLNSNSITANTSGVSINGSKATIISAGNYRISGALSDGQIVVNTTDNENVKLIFNGVDITCSSSAPVYIKKAKKVLIELADNTNNYITDGAAYILENTAENEPNAAIFSKADLTIYGAGFLSVIGNYNDGISSKDGLIIASGNYDVTAVDDGIRGKDYLIIHNGNIIVKSGGDGIKSDNENDSSFGYVCVDTGIINITAGGDAVSAVTALTINNGKFNLISGGGSSAVISSDISAKGLKAGTQLTVNNGTIGISSADDAFHSNLNMTILPLRAAMMAFIQNLRSLLTAEL